MKLSNRDGDIKRHRVDKLESGKSSWDPRVARNQKMLRDIRRMGRH